MPTARNPEPELDALLAEVERLRAVEAEYETARASLEESEGRYRSVVKALDDGVVLHDHDGNIIAFNDSALRVLGLSADQLHGRTSLDPHWRCIHPDGTPFPGSEHPGRKSLQTGETFHGVVMGVHKPDGTLSWISINSRPVEQAGGSGRYSVVASFCDITEQINSRRALQEREQDLRRALREKEILLRELHHRTRNNMAVVRSLLAIRAATSADDGLAAVLKEVDARIGAMELVHRTLYRSPDLARVDLASYLTELMAALQASYGVGSDRVTIEAQLSSTEAPLDLAIPFGLIATEVFSNCLKHAFPDGRSGTVRVCLDCSEPPELELTIADDGVGLPDGYDRANTLGLTTLSQLVRHQLRGDYELVSERGVTFHMRFSGNLYEEAPA